MYFNYFFLLLSIKMDKNCVSSAFENQNHGFDLSFIFHFIPFRIRCRCWLSRCVSGRWSNEFRKLRKNKSHTTTSAGKLCAIWMLMRVLIHTQVDSQNNKSIIWRFVGKPLSDMKKEKTKKTKTNATKFWNANENDTKSVRRRKRETKMNAFGRSVVWLYAANEQ